MTTKELSEQEIKPICYREWNSVHGWLIYPISKTKGAEPLYSESTVAALRAEIERLKKQIPDIKILTERFLGWNVPVTCRPDGINGDPHRTGTNLLSYDEAKEMFEYVLQLQSPHFDSNKCLVCDKNHGGLACPEMQVIAFKEHLQKCSDEVATWPEWKKPAQIDERAEFEKFMSGQLFPDSYFFKSPLTNLYVNETIQCYWLGWQARSQLEKEST